MNTTISQLIRDRIKKAKIKNWNGAGYMIQELEQLLERIQLIEEERERNNVELLASELHTIWGNWFNYQYHNSTEDNTERWITQSITKYEYLSEEDKEKDRKIAREILEKITTNNQ